MAVIFDWSKLPDINKNPWCVVGMLFNLAGVGGPAYEVYNPRTGITKLRFHGRYKKYIVVGFDVCSASFILMRYRPRGYGQTQPVKYYVFENHFHAMAFI